jgi:anaerobic selenocysteine-containing dehydrogenase
MGVWHKTFCRNCSALCAMEAEVSAGVDGPRVTRVRPDGSISPYGGYMCPKGLASVEFHQGAEGRLLHSLARQADGGLAPIATDAALDAIGARLKALVAEHGPRCVAVYHGTGAYRSVLGGLMERAFVAALGTPNFFSTMTIDQSAKWVTMARLGVMASGRHAIRDADLALLAGGNPVVTHQGAPFAVAESGAPGRCFEALRARGGKFILVDPRRNETARFADLLIQPLPGHDAEIFAAIAHILLRDGTYDAAFIGCHAEGLEALRAALAPFTPAVAAARADVPVAEIEQAAAWLGAAQRPLVGSGTGPSMAARSNLADHMIELCGVLAGGYRRAGDRIRNPGTLRPKVAREMAVPPSRSFAAGPFCLSEHIGPLMGEFPAALIPGEIMADHPERIRALISFGGDPLVAMGDPAVALPAFEHLDLLVALDCRLNETAKRADYVVACSQGFERHDITVPGDGLFPEAFAQYAEPLVEKPAGVIHDHEFFHGIAARMGIPLTFKFWAYGLDWHAIPEGLPLAMDAPPDGAALCRFLAAGSTVPFDELVAHPGGVRPAAPPAEVLPAPEGWAGRLHLLAPDVAAELAELAGELAAPAVDAAFPYRLTCRRILHALNGAYRDARETRRRHPFNPAFMAPADMVAEGLAEGDAIEIASPHGMIEARVRGEERLRRGVISMTHMFGTLTGEGDQGGAVNVGRLTSLTTDRQAINFMPRFSGLPIRIRRIAES